MGALRRSLLPVDAYLLDRPRGRQLFFLVKTIPRHQRGRLWRRISLLLVGTWMVPIDQGLFEFRPPLLLKCTYRVTGGTEDEDSLSSLASERSKMDCSSLLSSLSRIAEDSSSPIQKKLIVGRVSWCGTVERQASYLTG